MWQGSSMHCNPLEDKWQPWVPPIFPIPWRLAVLPPLFKLALLDLLLFLTIGPQMQPVVMTAARSYVLWPDVPMPCHQVIDIFVILIILKIIWMIIVVAISRELSLWSSLSTITTHSVKFVIRYCTIVTMAPVQNVVQAFAHGCRWMQCEVVSVMVAPIIQLVSIHHLFKCPNPILVYWPYIRILCLLSKTFLWYCAECGHNVLWEL